MDAAPDLTAIADRFLQVMPHARMLAMSAVDVGPGRAVVAMPYDARLVGDAATGVLHGGVVSALMDTACGAAVLTHPVRTPTTATLDLRIDYMRPATPGQTITAEAQVYHMTRSVAFVHATARDDDTARPVATATAAFTVGT